MTIAYIEQGVACLLRPPSSDPKGIPGTDRHLLREDPNRCPRYPHVKGSQNATRRRSLCLRVVSSKRPAPRPRREQSHATADWHETRESDRIKNWDKGKRKKRMPTQKWLNGRDGRPQILDWGKAYFSDQVDPYNARVSDRTQLSQVDLWRFPKGEADKRVRVLV